ncbi:MAG: zf-HC2 domain-containing protein [Pirellulaceae bacterium]
MKCREFVDFLVDYLDGQLPPEQLEVFKKHLELCPPCLEYLESYKTTIELGRLACCKHEEDAPPQMPEGLVRAILKARQTGDSQGAPDGRGPASEP